MPARPVVQQPAGCGHSDVVENPAPESGSVLPPGCKWPPQHPEVLSARGELDAVT